MSQTRNLLMTGEPAYQDSPAPASCLIIDDKSWFDTGRIRTSHTKLILECNTSQMSTQYYATLMGDNFAYDNSLYVRVTPQGTLVAYDATFHELKGYNPKAENILIADTAIKEWTINGTEAQAFSGSSKPNADTLSIYLGAYHRADHDVAYSANGLAIRRLRWYEYDELVMQLVAALSPDGQPCLYDTVTGNYLMPLGTGTVRIEDI